MRSCDYPAFRQLTPFYRGYILGPPSPSSVDIDDNWLASPERHLPQSKALPVSLAFAKQFARGALLSAAWDSGKVSMIPLYFG